MPHYRIGVDVGGTNTDGVLLDLEAQSSPERGVKAWYKHPTTPDVTDGIEAAVRTVIKEGGVKPEEVKSLILGTTHFINAVLEADARRLRKVAVLRLGAPFTKSTPPFTDFPEELRAIVEGHHAILDGGLEVDGRVINPVSERQVVEECAVIKEKGIKDVVVVGVHSPLETAGNSQEDRVREIVQREIGIEVNVVCSREVGQIGLLERENASILNASILNFAKRTVRGFQRAMSRLQLLCPLYLTQNDGTLTTATRAALLPIRTFASGQTNSMRGAAYLSGLGRRGSSAVQPKAMMVVDVGGTSTDVGILLPSGFPRQAAAFIEVGGVRTNFSMPDILSIGLGGGSIVRIADSGAVTVGPDSVGYAITREAKVFGGPTLTSTDIVMADGLPEGSPAVGDASLVEGKVEPSTVKAAKSAMKRLLEGIIYRMKTSPEPIDVLLVGGGSIIVPENLEGVARLIRPPSFSVANAVGAAVAKVAGEVDRIDILQGKDVTQVLAERKKEAVKIAIDKGARPETVEVVEVEMIPLSYVSNQATRVMVRAVGELSNEIPADAMNGLPLFVDGPDEVEEARRIDSKAKAAKEKVLVDIDSYRPQINNKLEWILSETDLVWIAEGCGILGTGGGGSTYPIFLVAREIIRKGGVIRVIDSSSLLDEELILRGCFMGSPSVSIEKIQSGQELVDATDALKDFYKIDKVDGLVADEIGGGNGMEPLILGSSSGLDIPVVDGDLMGRAYPHMWQSLPGAYDLPEGLVPAALADGLGNTVIIRSTKDKYGVEGIMRPICTEMGSIAAVCLAPMKKSVYSRCSVRNSLSQAWRIGRAVAKCRRNNDMNNVVSAILENQAGACLFVGKIVELRRDVTKGFTFGSIKVEKLAEDDEDSAGDDLQTGEHLMIPFQNENLYAYLVYPDGTTKDVCVVPDLITVLDSQSGSALGTPDYRFGLRVTVIALAGDPQWTTPKGLEAGGPKAFGLDIEYFNAVGEYREPRSVIEEYR